MTTMSKARLWSGRLLSALGVIFLVFDGATKLMHTPPVLEAMTRLGYPESTISGVGLLVLACTALYVIPPTAALGAVLLTGFLGGAMSAHVRVGDPLLSHVLFPAFLGGVLWLGLLLRRPRLWPLLGPGSTGEE